MQQLSFCIDDEDNEVLAVYFKLTNEPIVRTLEINPECHLDLDAQGAVVGAELLAPGKLEIICEIADQYHSPLLRRLAERAQQPLAGVA